MYRALILSMTIGISGLAIQAQTAEPFDPYKAYQQKTSDGEVPQDLPEPVEVVEPADEIVEAIPMEGLTPEENAAWMDEMEVQSRQQAEEDKVATKAEIAPVPDAPTETVAESIVESEAAPEPASKLPDDIENYISSDQYFRDKTKQPLPEAPIPVDAITDEQFETELIMESPRNAPKPNVEEPAPEKPRETKPDLDMLPVAPFYLTAEEYRALRPSSPQPQLILNYQVVRQPLAGAGPQSQRMLTLILGADFTLLTYTGLGSDQPAKLYDFKMNRILQLDVTPNEKVTFSNASLHSSILRNTRLIADVTNKGKASSVDAGSNLSLHPVWIESAMSYAMADRRNLFDVEMNGSDVLASFEDAIVLKVKMSDVTYPDADYSNAFLAFAHNAVPIHPALLRFFYAADHPPALLEFVVYNPENPAGARESWTLLESAWVEEEFPLPPDALGVNKTAAQDPLVFVMRKGFDTAPPGLKELGAAFSKALDAEDFNAAILAGQRYQHYAGPCDKRKSDETCTAITALMSDPSLPEEAASLAAAFSNADSRSGYADAVATMAPMTKDAEAPAEILYSAGITRAKLRGGAAKSAGVETMDAEVLLLRALAKDPHNPAILTGLAQLFAVKQRYEAAWDMHDALRVVLARPELNGTTVKASIGRVENNLEQDAPGYFIP